MKGSGSSKALSFQIWDKAVPGGSTVCGKATCSPRTTAAAIATPLMATGSVRRNRTANITGLLVISGNHGNKVGLGWETPGEIASIRCGAGSAATKAGANASAKGAEARGAIHGAAVANR